MVGRQQQGRTQCVAAWNVFCLELPYGHTRRLGPDVLCCLPCNTTRTSVQAGCKQEIFTCILSAVDPHGLVWCGLFVNGSVCALGGLTPCWVGYAGSVVPCAYQSGPDSGWGFASELNWPDTHPAQHGVTILGVEAAVCPTCNCPLPVGSNLAQTAAVRGASQVS